MSSAKKDALSTYPGLKAMHDLLAVSTFCTLTQAFILNIIGEEQKVCL